MSRVRSLDEGGLACRSAARGGGGGGCRIMVIMSASQAEDGGSIPLTRSLVCPSLSEGGKPLFKNAEIAQLVEQRIRNA